MGTVNYAQYSDISLFKFVFLPLYRNFYQCVLKEE